MQDTTLTRAPLIEAGMLIGGEKVMAGRRIEVRNPAHADQIVGSIIQCTPDDVNRAVAAAKAAQPAWAAKTFSERAAIMARGVDLIEQGLDERARLYTRENGKTFADARGELSSIPPVARLTLELAPEIDAEQQLSAPNGRTIVHYVPYGVVVCIVPWNSPVTLAALQFIPALLAGNAVVLKVPESCPLALIETAELLAEVLPPGLFNIISGLPLEIGDTLTTHPDVGKIAFTGSVPSARKIIANAAQSIKGITAELGGNDAAIVLEDVDLGDETMGRMADIVFRMAGQICMAIKRIYVPATIHDRFVEAFTRAVDKVVVGDGLVPGVTMGPVHTKESLQRAQGYVADARARGATIREFGKVDDEKTFAEGYFMRPTVVTDIGDDAPLVVEEQFCPALPILKYGDTEEALARANASIYGLGGSVWSRDTEGAMVIARKIQAGTVFVNTHGTRSVNRRAPYGGLKQSGVGRRMGVEGLREYMQSQTLTTFES
jgi:acyl-CoA reductase-like NAD-dependent aldehyde dehydrogenase